MKSLFIGCIAGITAFSAFGQAAPTKDQVKAKLMEKATNVYKLVVSEPDKRLEGGVYKLYYGFRSYAKTEYPGVERIYSSTVRYIPSGGKYIFDKTLTGDGYYTGIPNPSVSEIEEMLNRPEVQSKFFDNYYYIVGEIPQIKVSANPEFFWGNLNAVVYNVTADYTYLDGNKLKTVHQESQANMSRSTDGNSWDPKAKLLNDGKWNVSKIYFTGTNGKEEVSVKEVTDSEKENLVTVGNLIDQKVASERMSSLPTISIPTFNSALHAVQFIHETLMEGDPSKSQALLMQMGGAAYMLDTEKKILNQRGEELFKELGEHANNYPKAFCLHPIVKEKSSSGQMVVFYQRDAVHFDRIEVYYTKNGDWKFSNIGILTNVDIANKMADFGDSNCGEALDTAAPAAIHQYKIGERVMGEYRGQWMSGTVEKKDDMMDNRYWVKFDTANGQWLTHDKMKPGTDSKAEKKATTTSTNQDSNASDKVENAKSKINGLKGKIKVP